MLPRLNSTSQNSYCIMEDFQVLSKEEKITFSNNIKANSTEVYILSLEEMDHVIKSNIKGNNIKSNWDKLKSKVEFSASYFASANSGDSIPISYFFNQYTVSV